MPILFDADRYIPIQRRELQEKINNLLDVNMEDLFNEYVVQEIRVISAAANLPRSFIDGIKFVKTGQNEGEIINTWGTDEKPLAKWFNYGTTTHWIEPKDPDGVLVWSNTFGSNAPAIYFQGSGSKEGDLMFSTGHYVSGVPRTEAMEIGYTLGSKKLALETSKMVEKYLEENDG